MTTGTAGELLCTLNCFEQSLRAELELLHQRGIERHPVLEIGARAIRGHRGLRQARELVGELASGGERVARWDDAVDEAERERFFRVDSAAREDQVERTREADQARQPDRAAVDQRHAEPPAEHAEHGILGGDPEIAPQRELEAAGHGMPFDRRDHRLREQHPRWPHRTIAIALDAVTRTGGHRLEIRAGAEHAVIAVQHRDASGVVGVEAAKRVRECLRRRSVDGVFVRRSTEADDDDGPLPFDAHLGSLAEPGDASCRIVPATAGNHRFKVASMRASLIAIILIGASHAAADPLTGVNLEGWYGKLGVETGVAFGAERGTSPVVGGIATLVHINDRREWIGLQGDLLADGNGARGTSARWSIGPEAGVSIYGVDVSYMGRRLDGATQHGMALRAKLTVGVAAVYARASYSLVGADEMEVDLGIQLKAPLWIKRRRRGATAVAAR